MRTPLIATVAVAMTAVMAVHGQAPAPPDAGTRLRVPYTEFTLANGLHVILHRDRCNQRCSHVPRSSLPVSRRGRLLHITG